LAAILHLTGQEPREYGFTRIRANPQFVFEPGSLALDNDEQRATAIAKWRAWKAAQHSDDAAPR
jgi:hypothetical protein